METYKCAFCGKEYKTEKGLRTHETELCLENPESLKSIEALETTPEPTIDNNQLSNESPVEDIQPLETDVIEPIEELNIEPEIMTAEEAENQFLINYFKDKRLDNITIKPEDAEILIDIYVNKYNKPRPKASCSYQMVTVFCSLYRYTKKYLK